MMKYNKIKCPKCSNIEFWKTADKRLKCKKCRYIFTPRLNPFNISNELLERIISDFILEHSIKIISERVNISKYKLLKVSTLLRKLMFNDINLRQPYVPAKRPVIGIVYKEGKFSAEIAQGVKAKDLKSSLKNKIPVPLNLQKYSGVAFKGCFHRLYPENKKERRISALEGFWGYLKRKLTGKGGIRKERLHLYLGEYSWRYNHRKLSLKEQEKRLHSLLSQYIKYK